MKNDPFAKLGGLDQKLFQKTEVQQAGEPENLKTRNHENLKNGEAVGFHAKTTDQISSSAAQAPQLSKPAAEQPQKYSTCLEPSIIKKIKMLALEDDVKDYEIVRRAMIEYFAKRNKA